jgi:hypothetical protein
VGPWSLPAVGGEDAVKELLLAAMVMEVDHNIFATMAMCYIDDRVYDLDGSHIPMSSEGGTRRYK